MSRVLSVTTDEHETDPRYGPENPTYKSVKLRTGVRQALRVGDELGLDPMELRETVRFFESTERQREVPDILELTDEEQEALYEWCTRLKEAVETEIDAQAIQSEYENLESGEQIADKVPESDLEYYWARGWALSVIDLCEFAAEHDTPIRRA